MRKLSILHVALGGRDGGATTQAAALVTGLVRRGHRVLCIVRRETPLERRMVALGAPVFPVQPDFPSGPGGIFTRWSSGRIGMLARDGSWDLVHYADPGELAAAGSIVATAGRGGAPPALVTWSGPGGHGPAPPPPALRRHHRRRGRVHVSSEALWAALVREGFDEELLTVVHPGIPLHEFTPDPEARAGAREELGLQEGDEAVGTVALMDRPRGVEELVEAMEILGRKRPQARLVIIGDGDRRARLRSVADRAGLASKAIFTGYRDDVGRILKALDLYVFPGRGQEVFPLSLIEAMAAAVPVVVCDQPGIREIIENGKQGLFVPESGAESLSRTIFRALADAGAARTMGQAGAVRVQRFSTRAMVDGMEKLYFGMTKKGDVA